MKKKLLNIFIILFLFVTYTYSENYKIPSEPICECFYSVEATDFSLWAPSASQVELRLYQDYDEEPIQIEPMIKSDKGLWKYTAEGNLKGYYYTFRVKSAGGWLKEIPGIFARAVSVNGLKGAVLDWNDTNPHDWNEYSRPLIKQPTDIVIYELHYRDFSFSPTSGMKNRGKYLSLTETKTCTPEGYASGLDHLKELGITHVQLLPSTDFASIDESRLEQDIYNWGYEPLNYNVPEGSYSTNPYNPVTRIKELKQTIQALHQAGIRVILDVVYNHTTNVFNCSFEQTVPGYFYRYNADGALADGSACGNETASEKNMMRKFMIESLAFWVEEYHIDGFRFDLMAIHDIETMNNIRTHLSNINPDILLYGEGWAASTPAYDTSKLAFKQNTYLMPGIGAFSDDMRDALRGSLDGKRGGFVSGISGNEDALMFGLVGAVEHSQVKYSIPWAVEPTQHISYVTCHDDHCLRDRLSMIAPDANEDELLRMNKLAQTAVFTSQGIPFIFCGEELFRTKQGVANSYNHSDDINMIDWSYKSKYHNLFMYYKNLIALRKQHPGFCLGSGDAVRMHIEFLPCEDDNLVAFLIKGLEGIDRAKNLVVLLNGSSRPKEVKLPHGQYTILAHDGEIDLDGFNTLYTDKFVVEPISASILANY